MTAQKVSLEKKVSKLDTKLKNEQLCRERLIWRIKKIRSECQSLKTSLV